MEKQYTVIDADRVQTKLHLETKPVGLTVTKKQSRESCVVEVIPPDPTGTKLSVSDTLLQDLLEDGAIELKDE